MSDETRSECSKWWAAHGTEVARWIADSDRMTELKPVLIELKERFGIDVRDDHFHLWPEAPPVDTRIEARLAFALKAHLLDEGTGWSPPDVSR